MSNTEIIIVGAGPSSIALAHTLKHKLGFEDFTVSALPSSQYRIQEINILTAFRYTKRRRGQEGYGGQTRILECEYKSSICRLYDTYCLQEAATCLQFYIPFLSTSILTGLKNSVKGQRSYNVSNNALLSVPKRHFNLKGEPDMESTVNKFDLRKHMHFRVECISAIWNERGFWEVHFRDLVTSIEYTRTCNAFVSAVGGISQPRDIRFPGMETFQGETFHTARWKHSYDYSGKRMAIIGNGCSAVQVVPEVVKEAAFVKQYARSPQWYHERPNRSFTALEKWCFKYIPLLERLIRLRLFLASDKMVAAYGPGEEASKIRAKAEVHARDYIFSMAPTKYHDFLVPNFPLGTFTFSIHWRDLLTCDRLQTPNLRSRLP